MRRLITLILMISLSQLSFSCFADATPKPSQSKSSNQPMIGYIKDGDLMDMCGCSFEHHTNTRGYTFSSDALGKIAWMNIDGADGLCCVNRNGSSLPQR